MARDREIQCKYYICEKQCSKGREGTFRHSCQTCDKYIPLKGAKPARTDKRKQIKEKEKARELRY